MTSQYWGDMPVSANGENSNGIAKIERDQMIIPRKISAQCPPIHQPEPVCKDGHCCKHGRDGEETQESASFAMDPIVTHTVQLIQYSRKLRRLIDAWQTQGEKPGELTPLSIAPKMPEYCGPNIKKSHKLFNSVSSHSHSLDRTQEPTSIDQVTCRALLRRSVATLFAHVGYDSANESLVQHMTDVAHTYLTQFMAHLRTAQDHQLQTGHTAFPDILEQVFHELGQGSVTSLHDFYQNRVIRYHDTEQQNAERLTAEYEMLRSMAPVIDVKPEKPETFTLIKIKDEPFSSDIQFPNLDESEDVDSDQMIQLEGLSNFEITVEQETVSGLTTEVDSRWSHSVKSETSESKAVAQLERYANPGSTPDPPPSTPAHSETGDNDPPSMSGSDIMSPPTLTKYNTGPSSRKKKKRH